MQGSRLILKDGKTVICHHGCQCSCHYQDGVMHNVACCRRCPECGEDIVVGFFYEHWNVCHGEAGESD